MQNSRLRILIIDDEKPARSRLTRMLGKFPELEIIGEASNGIVALQMIADLKPDTVFLDIEMPELDGFGVARSLGENGPAIIFCTAYDEHALKAFDVGAIDYIVKPVVDARLESTIQKLLKKHAVNSEHASKLNEVLSNLPHNRESRFAVRSGAKFVICDPKKISAIIARDHYSAILTEGRELLSDDSLDLFEKKLNPEHFLRIHRSGIVNITAIQELEREGDRKYVAILSDAHKTRVPVSRERLDELKAKLGL